MPCHDGALVRNAQVQSQCTPAWRTCALLALSAAQPDTWIHSGLTFLTNEGRASQANTAVGTQATLPLELSRPLQAETLCKRPWDWPRKLPDHSWILAVGAGKQCRKQHTNTHCTHVCERGQALGEEGGHVLDRGCGGCARLGRGRGAKAHVLASLAGGQVVRLGRVLLRVPRGDTGCSCELGSP